MGFMQTESVLQSKNRSGPAKNGFSVALMYISSKAKMKYVCGSCFMTKKKIG